MVRKLYVATIGNDETLFEVYEKIKPFIYKPQAKKCEYTGRGYLRIILEDDPAGVRYLLSLCKENCLHPHISQWVRYTKAEQEKCEFFNTFIPSPLELEGTDAADYGTQYEGGCPNCGLGGTPVGDVLVDRKFLKRRKWDIGTVLPDIYVSEKLRDIIESNGLTGVSFDREVKDYKGREMPKYYVMTVHNVLPPMSDTTWLWQEYNGPQCGHNTLYLRSDVQYEREKLEDVNDFNLTAEYVDNFKLRELIVTAKVRHLFLQHKVYSGFYPVAFSNGETQYSDDLLQEIMDIDRLSRPKRS